MSDLIRDVFQLARPEDIASEVKDVHEPAPQMGFFTDTTVCIGCKACEVACKQWNQLPADGFSWTGNSYDNTGELSATSWRHVKFVEQFPGGGWRVKGGGEEQTRKADQRISLDVGASN